MSKVKCFACHKTSHYASQCPNKKKGNKNVEVSTLAKVDEFAKKFEKEFSLMTSLSSSSFLVCQVIEAWFVDSSASQRMMGMRQIFLSFLEIDSNYHEGCALTLTLD